MIATDQNLDEIIKSNGLVLVDFWAEWCGPCKKMSPILLEVEAEYGLPVAKLNVDENSVKSQEYSVQSIPTMVLFEDGIAVKKIVGAMPKHKLLQEISEWI